MLICPHCEQPLIRDGQVYRCQLGHAFDIAREGYVNLLRRPTKLPADTKEMLSARRRFLERGYYAPLAETVAAYVREWLRTHGHATDPAAGGVVDAGCGEGYYTRALARTLGEGATPGALRMAPTTIGAAMHGATVTGDENVPLPPRIFGLDLSRDGVRMAAGLARHALTVQAPITEPISWIVANIKDRLPFADASVSVLVNIFAPHNADEFARVLIPGGLFLVTIPTEAHLRSARLTLGLLGIESGKKAHLHTQFQQHFTTSEERTLVYEMNLDHAAQRDLRLMAPGVPQWRDAQADTPAKAATLRTDASFCLLAFTSNPHFER